MVGSNPLFNRDSACRLNDFSTQCFRSREESFSDKVTRLCLGKEYKDNTGSKLWITFEVFFFFFFLTGHVGPEQYSGKAFACTWSTWIQSWTSHMISPSLCQEGFLSAEPGVTSEYCHCGPKTKQNKKPKDGLLR